MNESVGADLPIRRRLRPAVSLSWNLLVRDRKRFAKSALGVTFAILLILLQLGFQNALLDSSVELLRLLRGDIFLVRSDFESLLDGEGFPRERRVQALSVDGVSEAWPLLMDFMFWSNRDERTLHPIRVLGFDPRHNIFSDPEIAAHAEALTRRRSVIFDRASRSEYGRVAPGASVLQRRSVEVVGGFRLGTDFVADGNAIVSAETFFSLGPDFGSDYVEMVGIGTAAGEPPSRVAEGLREVLPRDVLVLTRKELRRRELARWERGTPISLVFRIGVIVGFLVGSVIVYQILYTEVVDHSKEFATLKAIGYEDHYLMLVVALQGLWLAAIGIVCSLALGGLTFAALGAATGLPLRLTWLRAGGVALLGLALCAVSGLLALRKVVESDPAEVF